MKRHATTIVFLVLVVAVSLFLLLDRDKVSTSESKLREKNAFPAWRKDDLARVEIAHDDETIVLQREGGAWQMRAPRDEHVDGPAVDRLLGTLEYATRVRTADEEAKGMTNVRARGALTMGDLVFHFVLGGPSPRPEGSSYFKVDDGAPFVVSKELADALLAPADTYRDRTVVPYLSTEIRRFDVERAPAAHVTLERLDDRSFLSGGLLASRVVVDKVWSALAEIRAESFANDEALVASRRLVVTIAPKDGTKPDAELVFGDACPGHPADVVVVRTKPTRVEACVPRIALDVLSGVGPADLAERHPFYFHHDEIEELRLEPLPSGRAIEVARRGTGFHLREPEDRELDGWETEAVNELLRLLESSTADDAPAHETFTGAIGRAKVRVGEVEETVEVGALDLVHHEARLHRLRDDAVLRVSLAVARRLLARATVLHPLALVPDKAAISRVRLRCGTPQDLVDEGSGLRLVTPAGYVTDGAITQLVDAVMKGKAVSWVADADDGSFGIDGTCTVGLGDRTVRLGGPADGGVYGTIDGEPGVFVAPVAVRTLAERIYVSHALLGPEPITALVVNGRGVSAVDPTASVVADRVVALATSDVGHDLVVDVIQASATTPKHRITCGPVGAPWRRCTVTGTKAVFDVHPSVFDGLLGTTRDAGADASIDRDAARP